MRDIRKTASYFEKYLRQEHSRAQKREEQLAACDDVEKRQRIYLSLLGYRMNILAASFSSGSDKKELTSLFNAACIAAEHAQQLSYENALILLSFAVMLEQTEPAKSLVQKINCAFADDKLLLYICQYIDCGKAEWRGDFLIPEIYASLDAVFAAETSAQKEKAALNYLDGWYERCKNCAWYNTLSSKFDTYTGYWSFESAAIAKILQLDISRLKKNEYFPVL